MNNKVLDMLNVKYIIQRGQASPNRTVMGNAWLVSKIESVPTADEEIRGLGNEFTVKNTGKGEFLVNNQAKAESKVYGQEKLEYIREIRNPQTNRLEKDTIDVRLSNGLKVGQTVGMVVDTNGLTELVPMQTLENDSLKGSLEELVTLTLDDQFDPSIEAIMLDSEAKNVSKKKFTREGTVKMTKYAPNQINYTANVTGKQFIVFSEIYYKEGWKAYVNGKEQPILKVNYALRGLEVDSGENKIEFKYDIPKYHTAGTMAMVGSILIFLALGGMLFLEWRNRKKEENATQTND
jgi:hypothetical protein